VRVVWAAVLLGTVACRTARGIVEDAPPERDTPQRGTAAARAALTRDDELSIDAVLLTRFFRPWGPQARWVDPRPLGDVRDSTADATAEPDETWADAIRESTGLARVCVFDAELAEACRGRDGGLLRFSHPYAEGADGARVYVYWAPARVAGGTRELPALGQPTFEMVFTMARVGRGWHIASQRGVNR